MPISSRPDDVDRTLDFERLVYILSHDLRKPMRHVAGFAQAFMEDYGNLEGLDDQAKEYLQEMIDGARRMESLLDGILLFANSGKIDECTIVDLKSLWDGVCSDNRLDFEEINALVQVEGSLPKVKGSPKLIYQLLGNLVANSVKFRSATMPLELGFRASQEAGRVAVEVEDNGIGIPDYLRENAFALFRRVGPQAQQTEGMGLGLAVSRRIVDAHGGRIAAFASESGGTIIRFDLPAGHDGPETPTSSAG